MDAREVDVLHAPEWRPGGGGVCGGMRVLRRFILWVKFTLLQMFMRDCASFHLRFSATTSGVVYSGKTLSERKAFQARGSRTSTAHKIAAVTVTVSHRKNLAAFYVITCKDASRLLCFFLRQHLRIGEILVLKDVQDAVFTL